jgi:dTDP-4-dehydrorhamnose reductase
MKTLILGSNGQLGQALADTVPSSWELMGLDLPELDITDADRLLTLCRDVRPDAIVNAAAYTAVDKAESEVDLATAVNVSGPRNAAAAARDVGARFVHISTDFVFDGGGLMPYKVDAETSPLSVYGLTKRDGELAALSASEGSAAIVRTAWLYSKTGNNFVKTMLRLMRERDELSVVTDQVGSPTWANSLATAVWALVDNSSLTGIFHWTDSGKASWHEFAVAVQEEALSLGFLETAIAIQPITTEDYPTPAARPRYSVLDCSSTCAALGLESTEWRVNLRQMLKEMGA